MNVTVFIDCDRLDGFDHRHDHGEQVRVAQRRVGGTSLRVPFSLRMFICHHVIVALLRHRIIITSSAYYIIGLLHHRIVTSSDYYIIGLLRRRIIILLRHYIILIHTFNRYKYIHLRKFSDKD